MCVLRHECHCLAPEYHCLNGLPVIGKFRLFLSLDYYKRCCYKLQRAQISSGRCIFCFWIYSRNRNFRSQAKSSSRILRSLQIVFHRRWVNLNPHHQCGRVLILQSPHQDLLLIFLTCNILIGIK